MSEPMPLITVQVTDDEDIEVLYYVDGNPVNVGADLMWPAVQTTVEQADAVAAAVKEAWLRQYEYYSGEKIDR